jgi:hypothetical protein
VSISQGSGEHIPRSEYHKIIIYPRQGISLRVPVLRLVVKHGAADRHGAALIWLWALQSKFLGIGAQEVLVQIRNEVADVVSSNAFLDEADFSKVASFPYLLGTKFRKYLCKFSCNAREVAAKTGAVISFE